MTKNLFVGVNVPQDPNNMTDLEKKHLPVIEGPDTIKVGECFQVEICVGKLLTHPNEHEHHIEFIDLYADDTYLLRLDLSGVTTCPCAKVCLQLLGPAVELVAYASCNMHGVWKGVKPITVSE